MIYRSNLECPDLTPRFRHAVSRPMGHSFGHDVLSDWADKSPKHPKFEIYKDCGFWTHDEAAILYNVALRTEGTWVDIGAHTGWTTAHIGMTNPVIAVDPLLADADFWLRFKQNITGSIKRLGEFHSTSAVFFKDVKVRDCVGVCIDGDDEPGEPLKDARGALKLGAEVIIFHDFIGQPVREAVGYLIGCGFKCRVYFTPHMVGLCWCGEFVPPDHTPDPLLPDLKERCPDFDFTRCE